MGGIRVIPNNPERKGMLDLRTEIPFSGSLALQMIKPFWKSEGGFPLVVFIQGSAWTKPNQFWEIPQLSRLARRGFVVASVTHHSAFEAPAPAFLKDVKTAIRFLRAHAEEYDINPNRVCAWGTSSGGNTALLIGLTGDDPAFETDEWAGQSTRVQAVVDCFGPTDLMKMAEVQYRDVKIDETNVFAALGGALDKVKTHSRAEICDLIRERLEEISPIRYVRPGLDLPPFLMLHGDADPVVLFEDSEAMYHKLVDCGYDASLVRVTNAEHEGTFWSEELDEMVFDFIEERI